MKNKVGTAVSSIIIGALGIVNLAFGQVVVPQQQDGIQTPVGLPQNNEEPAGWVITPRIAITETFTDDVALDQAFPQSDFVTTSTLGLTALHGGPRFNLNLDYTLNHIYYPSLDDDEFRHDLQMNSTTEVVNDLFFFDASAGVNQQFADRRGAFTNIFIGQTANRATVSIVNANPYLLHRVGGNFATLRTGYNYGYIHRSENPDFIGIDLGGESNQFHQANMILTSGTRFTKFNWNWTNQYQKQTLQNDPDLDIYSTTFTTEYQINRSIAAIGTLGYLKREGALQARNFDDPIWRVGGRLTPGPRTVLEVTYGKDFFANTWIVVGSYQITTNLAFDASYTDRYQTFSGDAFQNFQDGVGNDADLNQQFVNNIFTRIKTYRAGLAGTRGRSTITLAAVRRIAESQDPLTNFTRDSVGIIWRRLISPRLALNVAANFIEDDFVGAIQSEQFISGSIRLDYQVSQNIATSIEYIRTRREQEFLNYIPRTSNFVSLTLGYTF